MMVPGRVAGVACVVHPRLLQLRLPNRSRFALQSSPEIPGYYQEEGEAKTIKISFLGLFLLRGCVAVTPVTQEADASPQQFDAHAVNPIAIERVVSAVHRGDQIGVVKGGLLCVPHLSITAGGYWGGLIGVALQPRR
jgi:hypothetical protein